MKLIGCSPLLLVLLCYSLPCKAQFPYIDSKGMGARFFEKNTVEGMKKSINETVIAYKPIDATTAVEMSSRSRLYSPPIAFINYLEYQGMCDYYISPFKRKRCNNRLNYILEAHSKILGLVEGARLTKMNQGIKEQILEKYGSLTNTLFLELEQLKLEVYDDTYYRQWFLGHIHD